MDQDLYHSLEDNIIYICDEVRSQVKGVVGVDCGAEKHPRQVGYTSYGCVSKIREPELMYTPTCQCNSWTQSRNPVAI